jgi:hypothetical protein
VSDSFIKAASLALAWGFSGATAWLLLALADGWASRAALGKGAVLSLLSIVLAVPFSIALAGAAHSIDGPLAAAAMRAFLAAALCEESGRLIALLVLMRMMITSDPREFFIGVVAIGLGFGIIENLLYLRTSNTPLLVGALRGVMTAPAHLSFALLSGLGVWRWRRERAPMSVLAGMFLLAIMAHGAYDFAAMAWPNPREWPTSALSPITLVGLGALLVLATAAQGLAAFTTIDSFLWRIDETPSHDRTAARAPLSPVWTVFGRTLTFAGAVLGLGAIAGAILFKAIVPPILPLALAAAVSTGFWGVGWTYLASRQRESARARRMAAATPGQRRPDRFRTAA